MPIITECNFLYVFGRQKIKQDNKFVAGSYQIILNIYEIERDDSGSSLPKFKYLKQISLQKDIKGAQNALRPWVKQQNDDVFIGLESQWATNG